MSNFIEQPDFCDISKCKNCVHFRKDINNKINLCCAKQEKKQTTEDSSCFNGLFEKRDFKQELINYYEFTLVRQFYEIMMDVFEGIEFFDIINSFKYMIINTI